MNRETFNRLHGLRHENDAAGYAMDEMRPRFKRLAKRHKNGTAPRAVSAFNLFQTSGELALKLVLSVSPWPRATWLEPSAGLGRILDAIATTRPGDVMAVELAPECAGELYKQDRERVTIKQRDFLTVTPSEIGLFDFVAMNPPFHLRSDIRHIEHARKFLKPGGKLAAICMDTPHREKAFRHLAASWEKIPCGAFAKQGTSVATVLFTIQT